MHHQIPPKCRYTQLAFPLYSMKHQVIMRDLCWISCFCCFSVKSAALFSEKHSFMKSAALLMKSTVLFSEKRNSMKSTVLFSEKCNAFQWKRNFMKSTMLFSEKRSAFHANFMSFRVITKYRSFFRKTKYLWNAISFCQITNVITIFTRLISSRNYNNKFHEDENKC